jgi:hypothetical protein
MRGYRIGVYNHFYLKLGLGIMTKITLDKKNQNQNPMLVPLKRP